MDGILGCDLSGIVEEVGSDCKTEVRKGDKVYGVSHGANLVCSRTGPYNSNCTNEFRTMPRMVHLLNTFWSEMVMSPKFLME